jgi:ribosomal-protein-alanine N-acetyltransferase
MDCEIIWMRQGHIPEVLDIEGLCFEFPWFEEDFRRMLRQRNVVGMVAIQRGYIVGYMLYELHKTRIHVINFAVCPGYRRKGIGRAMAEKLIGKLHPNRRSRVTLEVRETNLNAQLFWKAMGFRAVSVLKNYYEDSPDEDAFLFQFRLNTEVPCSP